MTNYLAINRANWDERATIHAGSPDHDLDRYRRDPAAISDVMAFDRPRLGDVTGMRALHLQCHIGTETLSLAAETDADIDYVVSDVYSAPESLA